MANVFNIMGKWGVVMLGMISSKASPSPNSMVSLVLWEEAAISVLST